MPLFFARNPMADRPPQRRSSRLAKNLAMRLYLRTALKPKAPTLTESISDVWKTGLLFPEQVYLLFVLGKVEFRNFRSQKFKPDAVASALVSVLGPGVVETDDYRYFLGAEVFSRTAPPSDRALRKLWDRVGVRSSTFWENPPHEYPETVYARCQGNSKHPPAAARLIGLGASKKGFHSPLYPNSRMEVGLVPRCKCGRYHCDEECVFLCQVCASEASGDGQDHHAFPQGWECLACGRHHDRAFAYQSVGISGCACRGVVVTPKRRGRRARGEV